MGKITFTEAPPLARRTAYALGALLLAIGAAIVALAAGWITYPMTGLRAPRDVLLCTGLVFVLGGVVTAGGARLPKWLSHFLFALLLSAFAAIPLWIAFGSGEREFGGNGPWMAALLGFDPAAIGRLVFGGAGVLMGGFAMAAWWAWLAALPLAMRAVALLALVGAIGWFSWGRYQEPTDASASTDQDRLAQHIARLHADPDFKYATIGGSRNAYLLTREQSWIKQARSRMAAARQAPAGQVVQAIPRVDVAPVVDGLLAPGEWKGAWVIALEPEESGAMVYLMRHGANLYLGAEAPADRTEKGFDQMRFFFHIDLTPQLLNERVFLSSGGSSSALRSVRLPDGRDPGSQWNVLSKTSGRSAFGQHRSFELSIDLAEAGLDSGAPFPAYFEIEGDPLRDAKGKFKARHLEGRLGDRKSPLWLRVAQ